MRKISVKLVALAAIALIALACAPAFAGGGDPKVWVTTALPEGAGWLGTFGNDINDTGLVGGGYIDAVGATLPLYWECGAGWECDEYTNPIEEIGSPAGWENANGAVYSVNNHGLLGGGLWIGMEELAVVWDVKQGSVKNLHPDGAFASRVTAVSEPGDACGMTVHFDAAGPYFRGHFWSRHGDEDAVLPPLDGFRNSWGWGLNASGTVCGVTQTPGSHAVIWKDDEVIDIHPDLVALDERVERSWAYDIAANGTVVGMARLVQPTGDTEYLPYTWTEQHGAMFLDAAGRWRSIAYGVGGNAVTGQLGTWEVEGVQDAAVWVKGVLEVLPPLTGYPYGVGSGINRAGIVAGYSLPDHAPVLPHGWIAKKTRP